MNKEYLEELDALREKMIKAEEFAKKFPFFSKKILQEKITGEHAYIELGKRYKNLYLDWGINYCYVKSGTGRTISNYEGEYDMRLVNIYFNTLSLYDSHTKYGLDELGKYEGVFFYDSYNTTFYVYPEKIEEFLELANDWFNNATKELKIERARKENEELLKKLEANKILLGL